MNWDMVGALAELGGAVAVVASLLYLARQVRDSSLQSQRNRYFQLNREAMGFAEAMAHHKDWGELAFRGVTDRDSLGPSEAMRFNSGVLQIFRTYEAMYHYSLEGGVHDWGAGGLQAMMTDVIGLPGIQRYWADRKHWFSPEFRAEVDRLLPLTTATMLDSYSDPSSAGAS